MDTDDEMKRLKWLLVVGVLFLISAYFCWKELRYSMFGEKADATLVRVYETTEYGRRGRRIQKQAVEYRFDDKAMAKGVERKETDTISINEEPPRGPTVAIQYLSGSPGNSRLAGHTNYVWVVIFFGCLAFMVYKVFRMVQESKK